MTLANKLLIDEPPLQVLPSLAKAIGLNEAIVLQQVHFRLRISEYKRNGLRWWPCTYERLGDEFPFWSEPTVIRVIGNLEARKLLISTDTWNNKSRDRTKWYTIDYDEMEQLAERIAAQVTDQFDQSPDQIDQLSFKNQEEETDRSSDLDQPPSSSFSSLRDSPEEIARASGAPITVRGIKIYARYQNADPGDVLASEGFPLTPHVAQSLDNYLTDPAFTAFDVIAAILNASQANVRKWSYVERTLENWRKRGIGFADDVQRFITDQPEGWDIES